MRRTSIVVFMVVATTLISWLMMPDSMLNAEEKLKYCCSAQVFEAFETERLDAFTKATGIKVDLYIASSAICVNRLMNSFCDIASTARRLHYSHKEMGYVETPCCRDPLAVITNAKSNISTLSKKQLREIFGGDITNWNQLMGPDQPIILVIPGKDTGAYKNFRRFAMRHKDIRYDFMTYKSTMVMKAVECFPGAISFITKGAVLKHKAIKVIKIDGISPSHKDYPLSQVFSFITKGKPVGPAKAFINFVMSSKGKEIIKRRGMFPIQ